MIGWPATGSLGTTLAPSALVAIGESDCELLRDGALAQPVNALTSLVYVIVGVIVAVWSGGLRRRRPEALLFGLLVAGIGLGSVLFHGPQPVGSKALHDLPILLLGLLMATHDLALLRPAVRTLPTFAVVASVATVGGLAVPAVVPTLTAVVLVGVVALEYSVQRRRARPVARSVEVRSYLVMAVLAALGGLSYALGRTGAPLCDPDAVVQPHGLWHVLSVLVFATWWWLAYAAQERR